MSTLKRTGAVCKASASMYTCTCSRLQPRGTRAPSGTSVSPGQCDPTNTRPDIECAAVRCAANAQVIATDEPADPHLKLACPAAFEPQPGDKIHSDLSDETDEDL